MTVITYNIYAELLYKCFAVTSCSISSFEPSILNKSPHISAHKSPLDVLTLRNLKHKLPQKFSGSSTIRKFNSRIPNIKAAYKKSHLEKATIQKTEHEALSAIQEIEEWIHARALYQKLFGEIDRADAAKAKPDIYEKTWILTADYAAKKMFRGN